MIQILHLAYGTWGTMTEQDLKRNKECGGSIHTKVVHSTKTRKEADTIIRLLQAATLEGESFQLNKIRGALGLQTTT